MRESFDGEVILVHMRTGKYFSLRGSGQAIWDLVEAGCGSEEIGERLIASCEGDEREILMSVQSLLDELVLEGLIGPLPVAPTATAAVAPALTVAKKAFEPPVLVRYTDMQELLLLDPIHDVDATGWPTRKPQAE